MRVTPGGGSGFECGSYYETSGHDSLELTESRSNSPRLREPRWLRTDYLTAWLESHAKCSRDGSSGQGRQRRWDVRDGLNNGRGQYRHDHGWATKSDCRSAVGTLNTTVVPGATKVSV